MASVLREPRSAIDLARLYGKVDFTWELSEDLLRWHGPIDLLFHGIPQLLTGSSYLHRLTVADFWKRFSQIGDCLQEGKSYETSYHLVLPDGELCQVTESGTVVRDADSTRHRIDGSICVRDEPSPSSTRGPAADKIFEIPGRAVLLENLTVQMEKQPQESKARGGYLSFSIDRLNFIFMCYGMAVLQTLFNEVGKTLNGATRFDDFVGRSSGCTFGMVLNNTDDWGVAQAAERLISVVEQCKVEVPKGGFLKPVISAGGSGIDDTQTAMDIMLASEYNMFEMQNMKGVGVYTARGLRVQDRIERRKEGANQGPLKRRYYDKN